MQGSPSMVKGVGFRSLSCRGSWVRIPPSAPVFTKRLMETPTICLAEVYAKTLKLASLELAEKQRKRAETPQVSRGKNALNYGGFAFGGFNSLNLA